jgi:hypothetical protein
MDCGMVWFVRRESYDAIEVERALVQRGVLPERADEPAGPAGSLESDFTEYDPRKWALWRISMVRQFQPTVLKRLSDDDLLYLAGQSPEGYGGDEAYGVQLNRNKLTQNALRAQVELATRATRGAWLRSVTLAFASLIVGAVLSAWLT